ncbi:MAG: helix-turn-helix transcriptional regulator [Clostridiales bacterium]|jgi:transcriptional regulator with XRE-family HTH domain|nr:helix-turn-helix transcriptional regulator [Clostridiales bacterium]
MSYTIGSRIKELRTNHRISQEQMAALLDTTRQRYARLENGQVDISFVMIKKIADYLGVSTAEITSVEQEDKELVAFFREKNTSEDIVDSVVKIQKILRVFQAHEKLYYQMKARDEDVD